MRCCGHSREIVVFIVHLEQLSAHPYKKVTVVVDNTE
ncbi:MAG: hypothetical protein ACJA13_002916 [Paraglaciecola sp.]|jgi:hypothetical protein